MTLRCVGDDLLVPLVTGGRTAYINLDLAASAPPLVAVKEAVDEFLPWYSSVHRGSGYKSMISTEAYEAARAAVRSFLNARPNDTVIFTRNTTDATNMLAHAIPKNSRVLAFETEHHANLLPWRHHRVTFLAAPPSPAAALEDLERAVTVGRDAGSVQLVAVTGASNVTGELWPVQEIVRIAHKAGARVLLDAAQLAPHQHIDVAGWNVDYIAMSGHKLYAPYGAGVLLGRGDWLNEGEPYLVGGGAVEFVTTSDVLWTHLPDRQEAGSPNVVGAVALAVACKSLEAAGMTRLAAREATLFRRLLSGLDEIPGIERYSMWGPNSDRIGVVTFNLTGYSYGLLAAILSAEYGIGVRHGCFCAHPLMLHLLRVDCLTADGIRDAMRSGQNPTVPGAVRASIGLTTNGKQVESFIAAVATIARRGPQCDYKQVAGTDDYVPVRDSRDRPSIRALWGVSHS